MSGQHKHHCVGLLLEVDCTSASALNAGQTNRKSFAAEDADTELSQIKLPDKTHHYFIPSEVCLEERDSLPNPKSEPETRPQWFTLLSWLGRYWQALLDSFSRQPEFRIRQRRDRKGNLWWDVYDPITNQYASLASEDEVRIWIEQSYHHRFGQFRTPW
ncbi:hypothetical protein GS597_00045 [Synechococcales cyanobacterium C]|uniref:Uncharacterized protein n=1 Tax=Petrachloros mirabilis ULC683 TaxID=2781853 RepID=A0A8K1ZVI9_9CYAN|nr:hypothetical protein [Petrachloros mirabilis]NCJ04936.1 hypothetical protein [Petrachloros mirabilis ULC683]